MKKDLGIKPYIMPMPVLIVATYNEDDTSDAMNAAWGTLSSMNTVVLYLSAGHKTFKNIKNKKAFTVSIADEKHLIQADYVGIVSANTDKNKMKNSGFNIIKSNNVDAPIIIDLPLTIECILDHIDEKEGAVYGKVVNVIADDEVLTGGEVDLSKVNPICYDPSSRSYFKIGNKVGCAFKDGAILKK